jgi:alpha-glucoside transport system permease protein
MVILFLKILPVLLMLAFAAMVLWAGWLLVRPLVQGGGGGVLLKLLRAALGLGAVWLAFISVRAIFNVFSGAPPYGEPQHLAHAAVLEQLLPDGRC